MAPRSSTLAWKIPWMEEPGRLWSMGSLRVGHDWATSLSLFTFMHWRRKWQPTPVSLPGESQGRGSLVGCRLWDHTESDTTEATWQQQQQQQATRETPLLFLFYTHSLGDFCEVSWLYMPSTCRWLLIYISSLDLSPSSTTVLDPLLFFSIKKKFFFWLSVCSCVCPTVCLTSPFRVVMHISNLTSLT